MSQPSTDHQRSGHQVSRDPDASSSGPNNSSNTNGRAAPLQVVAEALDHMRYGVIQLTVHDGKLVQLDITERRRFAS